MNDAPTPAVPKREQITVKSEVPVLDTGIFEQMLRIAKIMVASPLVPEHLNRVMGPRTSQVQLSPDEALANCFLVVNQAVRWSMDPFAVAQHVFVTKGKVGYEGKLVAAVINSHPNLSKRLTYRFTGTPGKSDRGVVVIGKVKGNDEELTVEGTIGNWKTDNDSWSKIPDQMLTYRGAREWARRHMPEAILGVYAEEELTHAEVDVTSQGSTLPPEPGKNSAGDALRAHVTGNQTPATTESVQGESGQTDGHGEQPGQTAGEARSDDAAAATGGNAQTPENAQQVAKEAAREAAGNVGTPRLHKLYLSRLTTGTDLDFITATIDEVRGYQWADEVLAELKGAYARRVTELSSGK